MKNTYSLNGYLVEQENQEAQQRAFEAHVNLVIGVELKQLKELAANYKGYNFTDELREFIGELI